MQSFFQFTRGALIATAAVLTVTVTAAVLTVPTAAAADPLTDGAKAYKPFAVEHIGIALAGARELQAAVQAGDVKAGQAAWIKSRKGWEAAEPITGEFFAKLDEAIDAWPDAKQGYHAIEAALFSGKLAEIAAPAGKLVADLAQFDKELGAPTFTFTPQGLMNGATKLAYEVGENKSKGGESPYAGTSLNDMRDNVEGIEAVQKVVKVDDLKDVDQPALKRNGEELAVLLQSAAPKLKLKKPSVGE